MKVQLVESIEQLSAPDIAAWNRLARNVFQRWEWLGSWWHGYQSEYSLRIFKFTRDDQTIGFAPFCLMRSLTRGRTLQFLGAGKAATDHLSIIANQEDSEDICEGLVEHLLAEDDWDMLELDGIDVGDLHVSQLVQEFQSHEVEIETDHGIPCFAIELPDTWEEYVLRRSKSGRREIRDAQKRIDSGAIRFTEAKDAVELDRDWDHFVWLHQRRRNGQGMQGCFDYPGFEPFLRRAADDLAKSGLLRLVLAWNEDRPVAAQFAAVDEDSWSFYQSGMDPDARDLRPGACVFVHTIRESIRSQRKLYDLMRGDEAYKLRWRATERPTKRIRIYSPSAVGQLRRRVRAVGVNIKEFVKTNLIRPTN